MFGEEKLGLVPLPLEPFRYYQHGQRVVHLDGCVEFSKRSTYGFNLAAHRELAFSSGPCAYSRSA
jgi:hypothetical protein